MNTSEEVPDVSRLLKYSVSAIANIKMLDHITLNKLIMLNTFSIIYLCENYMYNNYTTSETKKQHGMIKIILVFCEEICYTI